jgi:hypothetical protein
MIFDLESASKEIAGHAALAGLLRDQSVDYLVTASLMSSPVFSVSVLTSFPVFSP